MRILFAKLLVGVTGLLIVVFALVFAVIQNPTDDAQVVAPDQGRLPTPEAGLGAPATKDTNGPAPQADPIARGRTVYAEQRCRACHSIAGEGNTRSPLDGVGGRLTEKQIRLWSVAPRR